MADSETESDLQKTGSRTQIDLAPLETDPQEITSLKHIAESCETHLQRLLQKEDAQEGIVKAKEGHWASRQYAEFNLWCARVGVHGEGLRSIDVRLKDVPEICNLLGRLLQSMERDFNELERLAEPSGRIIISTDDNNDDDDDDDGNDGEDNAGSNSSTLSFEALSSIGHSEADSAPETSLSSRRNLQLRAHIQDTIGRLQGHALRIADAGASHRRRRVELYRQKEGPKGAYDGFKALALYNAKLQFKKASEPFLERLAESFARRRIRLEYLREHQKKRIVDTPKLEQTSSPKLEAGPGIEVVEEKKAPESKRNVTYPSRPQDQRTVYTQTVKTELYLRPQPKRPEKAESVASVALRNPSFPPPPRCTNGCFQCPYCRLEFGSREAEKGYWSQHVMQDFEPYFCTWEGCNAPFDVPNTFEGLLSHLQSHMDVKFHVDMPDGQHKTFDENGFERHVTQHGSISEEMLTTMKEASRRKGLFMFESCPFCGGFPDNIEERFPDRDTNDVALFFPPFREDILDEDDDDVMTSAASQRRSAGQSIVEDSSEFVDSCLREDCDCKRVSTYDLSSALPDEPPNPVAIVWAEFFPDLPRYDPSPVQDDYYLSEEKLHPFVTRAQPFGLQDRAYIWNNLSISCNIEVIHGRLSPGSGLASLMVYNFQFPPINILRRITCVKVRLVYWSKTDDPYVRAISLKGLFSIRPATTAKEVKTLFGDAPAGMDRELRWEKETPYDSQDTTTVMGSIQVANRAFGHPNSASWTLRESASAKTGVPTVFNTAVLVTRTDNSPFRVTYYISTSIGGMNTVSKWVNSDDGSCIYNPSLPPTDNMGELDAENLSDINLEKFSYMSF